MDNKPYLVFSLNESLYGIEAQTVQEIFFLPELTPVVEAPRDIAGVLNLRGEILPVMDLNLRFGHRRRNYRTSDSVIILEWGGFRLGIIVNQVREVEELNPNTISNELSYGREPAQGEKVVRSTHHFVTGLAKIESQIVMLLDCQRLICSSEATVEPLTRPDAPLEDSVAGTENKELDSSLKEVPIFCPNATPEEREIFRSRAESLRQSSEGEDLSGLMSVAVVGLNGEYFGVDLQLVREFTDVRKVTPIPCTPAHIVGNMNLRGEIVTLVDIRGVLNLSGIGGSSTEKAIVVQVDDLVAGIAIDTVFDVRHLNPSSLTAVPAAVHAINDEYLRGTAPYDRTMMSILDIHKILSKGELVVNEEV